VQQFYIRDDISRHAPGRKDAKTIHKTMQVRHLTSSIKETYALYTNEHPGHKIGKSKFAEERSCNQQERSTGRGLMRRTIYFIQQTEWLKSWINLKLLTAADNVNFLLRYKEWEKIAKSRQFSI